MTSVKTKEQKHTDNWVATIAARRQAVLVAYDYHNNRSTSDAAYRAVNRAIFETHLDLLLQTVQGQLLAKYRNDAPTDAEILAHNDKLDKLGTQLKRQEELARTAPPENVIMTTIPVGP